eukprot:3932703-Rhodomonas_salina.1
MLESPTEPRSRRSEGMGVVRPRSRRLACSRRSIAVAASTRREGICPARTRKVSSGTEFPVQRAGLAEAGCAARLARG